MNKSDLAAQIADAHGLTKTAALDILNTTLGAIVASVASGEDVALHAFGTFKRVHKPSRTVNNPRGGDPIQTEERDAPKFTPSSAFEAAVKTGTAVPA